MYNSKIFRNTHSYLDKVLKKYNLSSGAYPYLIVLERNEGINQIGISNEIKNDKAMSARTINKLIETNLVYKEQDEKDSRSYKLYLTPEAKKLIPIIHDEINKVMEFMTEGLTEEEKNTTMKVLESIFEKSQHLKKGENI